MQLSPQSSNFVESENGVTCNPENSDPSPTYTCTFKMKDNDAGKVNGNAICRAQLTQGLDQCLFTPGPPGPVGPKRCYGRVESFKLGTTEFKCNNIRIFS